MHVIDGRLVIWRAECRGAKAEKERVRGHCTNPEKREVWAARISWKWLEVNEFQADFDVKATTVLTDWRLTVCPPVGYVGPSYLGALSSGRSWPGWVGPGMGGPVRTGSLLRLLWVLQCITRQIDEGHWAKQSDPSIYANAGRPLTWARNASAGISGGCWLGPVGGRTHSQPTAKEAEVVRMSTAGEEGENIRKQAGNGDGVSSWWHWGEEGRG